MHKVLEINQIKVMISKHLNKKIIDNLLQFSSCYKIYYNNNRLYAKTDYHKFYYNKIILYGKTDTRYISFCNFLNDMSIDIYHYLYEYLLNKYCIINIYPVHNYISISMNGKESDIDEIESFFNNLNSNIMNYINSIKLLYKL